jgi:hypothetical protein
MRNEQSWTPLGHGKEQHYRIIEDPALAKTSFY